MDKDILAKSMMEAFDNIGKQDIFERMQLTQKGENLILTMLMNMGGKATPGELMQHAECTAARLTAIAKSLESKGFVKRIQNVQDKRSTIIEMTADGITRFMNIQKEFVENIFNLIEKLGEQDAAEFARLLGRLSEVSTEIFELGEVVM